MMLTPGFSTSTFTLPAVAGCSVSGISITEAGLQVHTSDYGAFTRALAKLARARDIRLTTILPSDESLEKVFSYLVTT